MEFLETKALVAALDEDEEELERILGKMLPGERAKLWRACRRIIVCLEQPTGGEGDGEC
jgi:hypothetical protein